MATFPSNIELLTVEEFAQRFRVGRSTVFDWIASKKMVPGVHYFKIGKTIRIPWSLELLASLSTDSEDREKTPVRSGKCRTMVNLDY
jgi:excisionase family DNA binding protein